MRPSRGPPPKKAIDSACVRSLVCTFLHVTELWLGTDHCTGIKNRKTRSQSCISSFVQKGTKLVNLKAPSRRYSAATKRPLARIRNDKPEAGSTQGKVQP